MKNCIVGTIAVILGLLGCRPENAGLKMPDTRVWVEKLTVQDIGYSNAVLQGEVIQGKNARLDSLVVELSLNNGFSPVDHHFSISLSENSFKRSLDSLQGNREYFLRVAIYSGAGRHYSEVVKFQTPDFAVPTIQTEQPNDITFKSVIANGRIISLNGLPLEEYGFLLIEGPELPNLQNFDFKYSNSAPNQTLGLVSNTFDNLLFSREYTCVFYARNSRGLAYGNPVSFNTLAYPVLQIETGQASDITSGSVSIINNQMVSDTTGLLIISRSVLISTNNPPTESNSTLITGVINLTDTRFFNGSINSLSSGTTYYYRARVETPAGYNYGQVKAFTTPGF
jgi:hypothetical protein